MYLKYISLLVMVTSLGFGAACAEETPSSALKHSLPRDEVLPVDDQQEMFVAAYKQVGAGTVDPLKTPVPGFSPLIRMHYSFALKIAEEQGNPKDSIGILSHMWAQAEPLVAAGSITVGQMKAMSYQVATLLSYVQEQKKPTGLFPDPSEGPAPVLGGGMYGPFSSDPWWHDLSKFLINVQRPYEGNTFGYDPMGQAAPSLSTAPGFCCEAILCNKGGGFRYRRFLDTYLKREWPMFLSALSYDTGQKGPHGGIHYHSARFLDHDFTHFDDVITSFVGFLDEKEIPREQALSEWAKVRQILTPLYEKKTKENDIALFIFLRECAWGAYNEREGILASFLSDKPDSEKFFNFIEEMKQERGPSFRILDRTDENFMEYTEERYSGFHKDYEHILGHALGDRLVIPDEWPIERRIQTLGTALSSLLDAVYQDNKDLFEEDKGASAVKKPSAEGGGRL
ncbi:hypothetical protein OAN21_01275 [Alphaproteobacteria bacterium]|nr:hypothetical protein [Alphaproteobacteria bacterium]